MFGHQVVVVSEVGIVGHCGKTAAIASGILAPGQYGFVGKTNRDGAHPNAYCGKKTPSLPFCEVRNSNERHSKQYSKHARKNVSLLDSFASNKCPIMVCNVSLLIVN